MIFKKDPKISNKKPKINNKVVKSCKFYHASGEPQISAHFKWNN